MKNLLKISALALFVALGAFIISGINPSTASAQEDAPAVQTEEPENTEQAEDQDEEESSESETQSPYTYTAQAGDSYTKIARKAVQTYGWNEGTSLSLAEIVAAETFLTSDAGFPALEIGEEVSLSEDAVKAAVEKATNLDDASEKLWERYVSSVDFNTDNVGEPRE